MSSILTAGGLSLLLVSAGDLIQEPWPQTTTAPPITLLSDAVTGPREIVAATPHAKQHGSTEEGFGG
jgi:hypothetical protein